MVNTVKRLTNCVWYQTNCLRRSVTVAAWLQGASMQGAVTCTLAGVQRAISNGQQPWIMAHSGRDDRPGG